MEAFNDLSGNLNQTRVDFVDIDPVPEWERVKYNKFILKTLNRKLTIAFDVHTIPFVPNGPFELVYEELFPKKSSTLQYWHLPSDPQPQNLKHYVF